MVVSKRDLMLRVSEHYFTGKKASSFQNVNSNLTQQMQFLSSFDCTAYRLYVRYSNTLLSRS